MGTIKVASKVSILFDTFNNLEFREEVVVAQLVERSLPIPEVRGSNPVIGKNL